MDRTHLVQVCRVVFVSKRRIHLFSDDYLRRYYADTGKFWTPPVSLFRRELKRDMDEDLRDPSLATWMLQGVVFLPVYPDRAECVKVIKNCTDKVIVALGFDAAEVVNRHAPKSATVIVTPHPMREPFVGCGVFSKINQYISGDPIKWGDRK